MNKSYDPTGYSKYTSIGEKDKFKFEEMIVKSWHEMYKGSVAEEIVSDFIAKVKDLTPRSRSAIMTMANREIDVYNYKELDKNERTNNQ